MKKKFLILNLYLPSHRKAISSSPVTAGMAGETNLYLTTASFQVVVESDELLSEPPLLKNKQTQIPQPLLIKHILELTQTLLHLNVLFKVRDTELNTVLEVQPHQC